MAMQASRCQSINMISFSKFCGKTMYMYACVSKKTYFCQQILKHSRIKVLKVLINGSGVWMKCLMVNTWKVIRSDIKIVKMLKMISNDISLHAFINTTYTVCNCLYK